MILPSLVQRVAKDSSISSLERWLGIQLLTVMVRMGLRLVAVVAAEYPKLPAKPPNPPNRSAYT